MTVLTARGLNRALLARQMLLERAVVPVPDALERMGGLQAQYAPSMYIGLWTRLADLDRSSVTRLLEERAVVQATVLRGTIHLVSRADFWPFVEAVRQTRVRPEPEQVADVEAVAKLLAQGPLRRTEIDPSVRQRIHLYLDLVRVPPSGTWARRRADVYGLAEDWIGPPAVALAEARELLVRRYLGAFGPAHRSEIANWAGLPVDAISAVLGRLELRRFADERGRELVDLPDAPLPDPQTPAPVRFLPTWDAALLVHARRTLILPEEHRTKIFHMRMPQSIGTFLVDGQVAGTWAVKGDRVSWTAFEPLPDRVRNEVDAEAELLGAFHV
ncbi:winged helix DNA-binding domain-containing protein [Dactylosporangium sp. NPDC049140]|uniref:winged helix DNA-binding domain-containing protein n=1 Tax=Dactylosporangium sp. NPDC049140 TaxID=3155647 RepID=UPI0033FB1CA6